jgi:hypothetical protein
MADMLWDIVLVAFGLGVGAVSLRTWQRRKLVKLLPPKMNMIEARYEMLKAATRRPCAVMLGDSLTDGCPWSQVADCPAVENYGWSGDTTDGVLYRLREVILLKPHSVFMMIGANDLTKAKPTRETTANILAIVQKLEAEGINVIIHPVVPFVGAGERRDKLNLAVSQALAVTKARIVPLPIELSDLRDGQHLGPTGFAKWHETIRPLLAAHCQHVPVAAISA